MWYKIHLKTSIQKIFQILYSENYLSISKPYAEHLTKSYVHDITIFIKFSKAMCDNLCSRHTRVPIENGAFIIVVDNALYFSIYACVCTWVDAGACVCLTFCPFVRKSEITHRKRCVIFWFLFFFYSHFMVGITSYTHSHCATSKNKYNQYSYTIFIR